MEHVFNLGDFELESGEVLPRVRIVYETHGELSPSGDNAIVYATWYAGRHTDVAPAIGEGRALDSGKYFVVVPNSFDNALSSSPSNTELSECPLVSTADDVQAQYRLLTEHQLIRALRPSRARWSTTPARPVVPSVLVRPHTLRSTTLHRGSSLPRRLVSTAMKRSRDQAFPSNSP